MKIKRMYYKGIEKKKQCNMCKKYFNKSKINEVEIGKNGARKRHVLLCSNCYEELVEFTNGNNIKAEKYREILAHYLIKENKKVQTISDILNDNVKKENDYKICRCELEQRI